MNKNENTLIKSGEHKTKGGHKAWVVVANNKGAIGWVFIGTGGEGEPVAWDGDGFTHGVFTDQTLDLDLPRTLTIPESDLPEPVKTFAPYIGQSGEMVQFDILVKTREDAEAWAGWWRENVCKEV